MILYIKRTILTNYFCERTRHMSEEWEKYRQYIDIPCDASDNEKRPNMRFQFMFKSQQEANRILSSLPVELSSALKQGKCWFKGLNPTEGKFQIAWDGIRLTIGQGKELMNQVVSSGGEIYEAFLT